MIRFGLVLMLFGSTALVVGCGGGTDLLPVNGTVTLNGQPLGSGIVQFEPVGAGRPATGRLDANGNFQLTTDGETGARTGEYRVSVLPAGFARSEEDTRPPEKSPIPARYHSPGESGLRFTVEAGSENSFDVQLTS